ncbi:protein kinase [Streptomycetaceae bacterium NBC_01309]
MSVGEPLAEFARELRRVRGEAADSGTAEIARRIGVDEAVLTAALAGVIVPPLQVALDFVRECGGDTAGWEDRWRTAVSAQLSGATTTVRPVDVAPSGGTPAAPPPPPSVAPRVGPPPRPAAPPRTPPSTRPSGTAPTRPAAPPAAAPATPPTPPADPPRAHTQPPGEPGNPASRTAALTPPAATPQPQRDPETVEGPALPRAAQMPPPQAPAAGPAAAPVPTPTALPTAPNQNLAAAPAPSPAPVPAAPAPAATQSARHAGAWVGGPDRAALRPLEADDPRSVGGYVLRARLGAGGMGRVYLSATPGGRPVAIKVIRGEFSDDPEFRARFQQEVVAAQRVQGLYTAPVLDCDANAAQPWLATAYIAGPALNEAVLRHGPLPPESVLVLTAGVAEALQSVHAAGIVHRDLKPSNVILAADGPRVIDFGIARAADATPLTQTGFSIGTPSYMAPEQARGRPAVAATDVFSLGALAVFAATGAGPFGEGTDTSVLYRVVHEEPDLSACPAGVREVVARMLAKDPAERPTPAQVIELCRSASGDSRLHAAEGWLPATVRADIDLRADEEPPPLPPDPSVRAPKRKRRALVALAVFLVLAVVGAGTAVALMAGDDDKDKTAGPAANSGGTQTPPASGAPGTGNRTTTTPTGKPSSSGKSTSTASGTPQSSTSATSTATSSAASTASGPPQAGGLDEGDEVFRKDVDLPEGYCVSLENATPFQSVCPVSGGDGVVNFSGSESQVRGIELVLLNKGVTPDYQTCLDNTQYTRSIPYSFLESGSVICLKDKGNRLVGTITVVAPPADGLPSRFWKIVVTTWRGAI